MLTLALRRALSAHDASLLQVWFDAAVIERYRGRPDLQVIRTDTAGRVRRQGGWGVDVGIAPDERTVHASWSGLVGALPEDEQAHWAAHAAAPGGVSEAFLRMQLSPGSCFDDGDVRTWE